MCHRTPSHPPSKSMACDDQLTTLLLRRRHRKESLSPQLDEQMEVWLVSSSTLAVPVGQRWVTLPLEMQRMASCATGYAGEVQ